MNRQMRRHPVHPLLPVSPVSNKRDIDHKRSKNYVAEKQQRKWRRTV